MTSTTAAFPTPTYTWLSSAFDFPPHTPPRHHGCFHRICQASPKAQKLLLSSFFPGLDKGLQPPSPSPSFLSQLSWEDLLALSIGFLPFARGYGRSQSHSDLRLTSSLELHLCGSGLPAKEYLVHVQGQRLRHQGVPWSQVSIPAQQLPPTPGEAFLPPLLLTILTEHRVGVQAAVPSMSKCPIPVERH